MRQLKSAKHLNIRGLAIDKNKRRPKPPNAHQQWQRYEYSLNNGSPGGEVYLFSEDFL